MKTNIKNIQAERTLNSLTRIKKALLRASMLKETDAVRVGSCALRKDSAGNWYNLPCEVQGCNKKAVHTLVISAGIRKRETFENWQGGLNKNGSVAWSYNVCRKHGDSIKCVEGCECVGCLGLEPIGTSAIPADKMIGVEQAINCLCWGTEHLTKKL